MMIWNGVKQVEWKRRGKSVFEETVTRKAKERKGNV